MTTPADPTPAHWAVIEAHLRELLRHKDADWAHFDVAGARAPRTPADRDMCARYARTVLTDAMHAAHLGAVGRLTLPPTAAEPVPVRVLSRCLGRAVRLVLADGQELTGTLVFDDRALPAGADPGTALDDYVMVRTVVPTDQIAAAKVDWT